MKNDAFAERVRLALEAESENPLCWYYLSFVNDSGFLGAAIVQARGIVSASRVAHERGCNPGGEMLALALEESDPIPADKTYKLLSQEELSEAFEAYDGRRGSAVSDFVN